jgi:uncharacterized membrane protein YoaK (UPF0700 family)
MMSLQEHLDYISLRVTTSGVLGAVSGTFISLYRGYDSLFRTSARTAFSCALVSTACFSVERCAYVGMTQYLFDENEQEELMNNKKKQYYLKLYSHLVGGLLGGAYVGGLYTGKFMRGAFVFTPIMLLIAVTEEHVQFQLQTMKQLEIHREQKQQQP